MRVGSNGLFGRPLILPPLSGSESLSASIPATPLAGVCSRIALALRTSSCSWTNLMPCPSIPNTDADPDADELAERGR